MSMFELFWIAIGLSMDAFAVAICKGLAVKQSVWKKAIVAGLYFGGFQALMPAIGYILGAQFKDKIVEYDHWIAFILLGIIGSKMLKESFNKGDEDYADASVNVMKMLPLALATSIDALAVGVSFAFLKVNIIMAVTFIGITTFVCSLAGVKIGTIFGAALKSKAEAAGGIILILLGFKILVEHLGIWF